MARHATTHKRPRCPYPGTPSDHCGERTAAKSCRGCAQSPARYQYFERPNTRAVAGTFAVDERQRTGVAARLYYAATHSTGASRAPFRSPFRFPIPDGSLALIIDIGL